MTPDEQSMQDMGTGQTNDLAGAGQKITISMEEALSHVDQVSEDQFINEANNLVFKVSHQPFAASLNILTSLDD